MGRIRKAYATKFSQLLRSVGARRPAQGLAWFQARTDHVRDTSRCSEAEALAQVWQEVWARRQQWRHRAEHCPPPVAANPGAPPKLRFLCDAGLGGLARWLRAAGYEAHWIPDIADDQLLAEARRLPAVIVTTDSMLMERRVLRDGTLPAAWVSPARKPLEQLGTLLEELGLPLTEPRCMTCGGRLQPVDKETVRERIPPRTLRWLDEYFLCAACGKLFWRGTHWQRIQARLRQSRTGTQSPR